MDTYPRFPQRRIKQDPLQIAAMDDEIGRAPAFDGEIAEGDGSERFQAACVAKFDRSRRDGCRFKRGQEAKAIEKSGRIGGKLQPGTDRLKALRAFVNLDVEARTGEEEGGRQAGNAGTCDLDAPAHLRRRARDRPRLLGRSRPP